MAKETGRHLQAVNTITKTVRKGHWAYAGRLAAIALLLEGTTFAVQVSDDSVKIASNNSIPGKGGYTTCEIFAKELHKRLTKAGGESHLIIFKWRNGYNQSGTHAAVVFRDADGDYWSMDNRDKRPRRVSGRTARAWIRDRYDDYRTQLVSVKTDQRFKGQYASLSREKTRTVYVAAKKKQSKPKSKDLAYSSRRRTAAIRIPSLIPKPRKRVYLVETDSAIEWQIDRINRNWWRQTDQDFFLPSRDNTTDILLEPEVKSVYQSSQNYLDMQFSSPMGQLNIPTKLKTASSVPSEAPETTLFSSTWLPPLAAWPMGK